MDILIKQGERLSMQDFEAIMELDRKSFGDNIISNEGMAEKRFLKFKDGFIAAFADNVLIGFTCFFSVDSGIYQRAVDNQEYIDDNLNDTEVIPLEKGRDNDILLFDIVVEQAFQQQGVSNLLVNSIRDYLKKKNIEGCPIGKIIAFAITADGVNNMLYLGGKPIWSKDKVTLFELNNDIFLRYI
ncbi:GNAT family N-acetyltransferase [uncultured Acetobacterium sp.]|uniref:GNAT family N-acetyltransferase n=1 Tax=uncultured Acetobacterium sp. TaxID=217139 RepID=UPI0025F20581|nr:GNAT family N-acetyltransferase [uncultured Acetobacterium sp.]